MTYSSSKQLAANLVTLPVERVKEIIDMNKKGIKPDTLEGEKQESMEVPKDDYQNVVGQDSLTRFDKAKKKKKRHKHRNNNHHQNNAKE